MFLYILAISCYPLVSHEGGESDIQSSGVWGKAWIENLLLREIVLPKFVAI